MKRMSKTLAQVHKVSCLISLQQFIALLTSVFSKKKRYTSISVYQQDGQNKTIFNSHTNGIIQKGSTVEELKNMMTSLPIFNQIRIS